ncbi:Rho GTPase-activating protein 10 GTPase regulator associated with focal adhesion kinase 2 [Collichthys lucidus]|uniref:Rho GTPase-activating protein 10 GTPase regulator associated with focal adhesion kinase 2 n=1 Tax=Collichthys lucidus TaxID=240159 RepID=A0A4V6AMF1_COLLU|nr:Rho GTPase-activating protein 10 GTPase regulator associated with focal adhesion kinase 2 [Collichthys lucidus]
MGLHPLEFSECYLDSPCFREKIKAHEAELDKTNRFIKELYKDGKNLINATKQLGMAQRKFAQCLGEFQFEYIGDAKTDDEKCIDESLQEFSSFLKNLEDQRELMMRNITETLMKPLEKFRKDHLGTVRAERKKYEKETEKYYSSLEKLLNMSAKKKEPQLQEADSQVETMRQHFQEESLDYVCKLQEIQERKKFECVEPMLAFFQTVFTFYHQGFELAKDFDHYKRALQINIQNTRSRFEGARSEVYELMKRIKDTPQEYRQTSSISCEGYLYVQEKRPPPFGSSWVKRYSTFVKEQKILHMVTFDHRSGGKIGETESVTLKSCVRKTTDMLDRRFCLELDITDRPGTVLTVQALSEDDHKFWMQAMGGKEPIGHYLGRTWTKERGIDAQLDDLGLSLVKNSISAIETREGGSPESRIQAVHCLVHKLPERNRQVLGLLMKHLANVAAHSKQNLMTVANLGVVFGPTLMRPQEETVAAIMDLKFQNIVVEILIEHHEKIFADAPESCPLSPAAPVFSAPTRQSKKLSRQNRPLAVYNPQALDIQNASTVGDSSSLTTDETSMGSNESVSSQSSSASASEMSTERSDHTPLSTSLSSGSNSNALSPHADVEQLSTTVAPHCCRAINHPQSGQARMEQPPLGMDKRTESQAGEEIGPLQQESPGPLLECQEKTNLLPPQLLLKKKSQRRAWPISAVSGYVTSRKAKAVYPCEAEHDSELSFQVGAIFNAGKCYRLHQSLTQNQPWHIGFGGKPNTQSDLQSNREMRRGEGERRGVTQSREPGWLEGELEGKRGLIPENYVEML